MLDTHPQKAKLNVVLLPLARDALNTYSSVPQLVNHLKLHAEEMIKTKFAFKSVDYSFLNDDNLYYVKQLELTELRKKAIL